MVAAAVIGAAVVGAGATMAASNQSSKAIEGSTNASIAQQQQALTQQAQLSQPYRDLGTNSIETYQNLLTGGGKGAAGIQSTLENLPGYQFTRDQGIEAAKRSAAASGMNLSGNQLTAVEGFGANLADQTYSQRLQELLQPINLGQAAAAGQAANVGGAAANISNSLTGAGQTQAGIDANTAAGISRTLGSAAGQYMTYQTLAGLNNPAGGQTYQGGSAAPTGNYSYAPLATPDPVTTST